MNSTLHDSRRSLWYASSLLFGLSAGLVALLWYLFSQGDGRVSELASGDYGRVVLFENATPAPDWVLATWQLSKDGKIIDAGAIGMKKRGVSATYSVLHIQNDSFVLVDHANKIVLGCFEMDSVKSRFVRDPVRCKDAFLNKYRDRVASSYSWLGECKQSDAGPWGVD